MSLDKFNEYIVHEGKGMIANNVTPASDDHLRNTCRSSLLYCGGETQDCGGNGTPHIWYSFR